MWYTSTCLKDQCIAKNATCFRSNRLGHYGSLFLFKTVAKVEENIQDSDVAFLNMINSSKSKMWLKTIQLESKNVTFKLDTRADVSVISEELASSL